jgi:hypothetical protein
MRGFAVPVLVAVAVSMAGCAGPEPTPEPTTTITTPTPTPTPTPAPPALADLVVTPDGLGTLRIGDAPAPDPATAMVAFDDDICVYPEYGIEAGDPLAGGWAPLAIYGDGGPTAGIEGNAAFQIFVKDDVVVRIDLKDSSIPTEGGVRIGDTRDDLLAAHPDAVKAASSPISEVYRLTGSAGALDIEVKVEGAEFSGYWEPTDVDTVAWIRVVSRDTEAYGVAGGENVIFGCGYTP